MTLNFSAEALQEMKNAALRLNNERAALLLRENGDAGSDSGAVSRQDSQPPEAIPENVAVSAKKPRLEGDDADQNSEISSTKEKVLLIITNLIQDQK